MKVLTYNMMFGMYGKEALLNLLGHFSIHGIKSVFLTRLFSRFNKKTAELLIKKDADIVCINEVIGLRKNELINKFKLQGYYSYWGQSKHHKAPLNIGTIIFTKEKAEKMYFKLTNVSKPGGGGGSCATFFKEKKLVVLGIHLALRKKLVEKQINEVSEFINKQNKLGRKVILLGDFNLIEEKLRNYKEFEKLNLISASKKPTCPLIFELMLFKFKCVDNIFVSKGINIKSSQTFLGKSDHKGVYADLEL